MVGTVNAVNLTDGVDGLATGVTIPVMLFYVAVSAWYGRSDLITAAAAMAGGLSAFLILTSTPPRCSWGTRALCSWGRGVRDGLCPGPAHDHPGGGPDLWWRCCPTSSRWSISKKTGGSAFSAWHPAPPSGDGGWSENKLFCVFSGLTLLLCVLAFWGSCTGIPCDLRTRRTGRTERRSPMARKPKRDLTVEEQLAGGPWTCPSSCWCCCCWGSG